MLTLSFESSAKAASVALTDGDKLLGQYFQNSGLTHSRTLLPMADNLMHNLDLKPTDIDLFAVAKGPGSFTGIRIGIATVKGMAFALEKPCCGVSSLEAMAWHALNMDGLICCVMDARRNQVYNALFQSKDGKISRLCEDRAISLENLAEDIYEKKVLLVGDGAELCYNWLSKRGQNVQMLSENIRFQSAWGVAMAAKDTQSISPHDLKPNYIRLSQAERELLKKKQIN